MIDFVEYVVAELSSKRLSKADALALMRQFHLRTAPCTAGSVIHPLLHSNTSDIDQQSYTTRLGGDEFFLRDHEVEGRKVLPGVAYLEMARAALETAVPAEPEQHSVELRNIIWAQPIVVTRPEEITIALFADDTRADDKQFDYEIYSVQPGEGTHTSERIHSRGIAALVGSAEPVRLELEPLEAQMRRGELEAADIYAAYAKMGITYGPAHKAITRIRQGERQLLAWLSLPAAAGPTLEDFQLHPSLMDAAIQSALGLIDDIAHLPSRPALPFALDSLRCLRRCSHEMVAWVRYAPGSGPGDRVTRLDIDLCDAQGNVCVQMRGFTSRTLVAEVDTSEGEVEAAESTVLYAAPVWETEPPAAQNTAAAPNHSQRHILLCGMPQIEARTLEAEIPGAICLSVPATLRGELAQRYCEVALACFERIQEVLAGKPQAPVLIQLVAPHGEDESLLTGLTGLFKTATRENPALTGQVIFADAGITAPELARRLQREVHAGQNPAVRYELGVRQVLRWRELPLSDSQPGVAFKDQGVYLITGGLGGLGVLFAKDIIRRTRDAKIILTGRSELTPERKATLEALASGSCSVEYRRMDVADPEDVRLVIDSIVDEHKHLSGIIHAAGMIRDNFILKKTGEEFRQVLEPKVAGAFNLDAACLSMCLDFFALFSAGAAVTGNAGQADYAAANGFMDQFAAHRSRRVATGKRQGKTLAINWPLWQEGGMRVDAAIAERLETSAGMRPMRTATGLRAFQHCLQLPHDQVQVVEGDLPKLRKLLLLSEQPVSEQPAAQARVDAPAPNPLREAAVDAGDLRRRTHDFLKRQLAPVLKLAPGTIDAAAPFEKYGIDSILAMKLIAELEKTFGSLPKTLFFEYQTLSELARYFIQSHAARLAGLIDTLSSLSNDRLSPAGAPEARVSHAAHPDVRRSKKPGRRRRLAVTKAANGITVSADNDPIAIVGLSGRYPEAPDIDAFWRNLRDGKDCIIEVPRERWDWREYFSEDRAEAGRHYSKWGGFIQGVDEFDPLFFNISPREARIIDPQERLFLQHAWMAVEDAGYTRAALQVPGKQRLPGQVGVYVGVMYGEYNLSGSLASIANRVSYVLNLHGPSMTLDTMCSSSLTAIHLACQDLKQRRTDLAIAGGVNVSIHPSKYALLSAGQFISSEGHCQSFGEGGDGYIPGEGVGAVILKRLSDAEKDGDHIYGVIKGSALNHGGKTNGYTVPNPQAQAAVILQALSESNTNPRHISYVEAHGTGTRLGDPIEIAALSKAFHADSPQGAARDRATAFCAIGSAKSNIGHCESAAGIAGLTKILLQLRHGQIAPSLHSTRLNPNIDFDNTPFVVNQALRSWDRPVLDGRQLPRIASLSSFGAGGSNAHLIVEEYAAPAVIPSPAVPSSVLVPLSARTAEQLEQRARDLLSFLQTRGEHEALHLSALAYTLQVGREALEERLGFVVSSVAQLAEKLQAHLAGEQDIEGVLQARVKDHHDTLSLFSADADLQDTIDKWIARRNLPKLLELWVKGLELDWAKGYADVKPGRISLPTYPFAREKYWIETVGQVVPGAAARETTSPAPAVVLHPLLHANTSDLNEQRYTSLLSGDVPAIAYLEMTRAALAQAVRDPPEASILELRDVIWGQPRAVTTRSPVTIALFAASDGQIDYDIFSQEQSAETVHCQGRACFSRQPAPARLDVASLQARMKQAQPAATHPVIVALYRGENEILAKLTAPASECAGESGYLLSPGMLEGALHASAGLTGHSASPAALGCLRIVFACVKDMYLWARESEGRLDIDLCDPQGNVCVQLSGLLLQHTASPLTSLAVEKPRAIQLINLQTTEAVAGPESSTARKTGSVQLLGLQDLSAPTTPSAAAPRAIEDESDYPPDAEEEAPAMQEAVDRPAVVRPAREISSDELQMQLRASLAEALYMDASDIDSDKPFVELGLDSIVGVEWVKVINKQNGLSFPATRVYDYPNIKALASFVQSEIGKLESASAPATLERSVEPPKAAPRKPTAKRAEARPATSRIAAPAREPSAVFSGASTVLRRKARASRIIESAPASMAAAQAASAPPAEKIAIVGMSGRYPQASTLQEYWDNLAQGRNSVVEIPPSRWDVNAYYDPQPGKPGKVYCKWLGLLDDVDCFDPLFFQISPADAQNMDPQHRLFMQEAYRAFEDAGYSNRTLSSKKCGVYLGIMSNEYSLLLSRSGSSTVDTTGNSFAIGAARIAYYLNLKGPAIPVDTACSSSLVAIHLACQALQNREIDMALAGGVTLYLTPESYLGMCQAGMLSPDGQCKTFDHSANGFVPGEGVGAVVLKRLRDAERDNDTIYGVIVGSGINQDGKTNGITAPSVSSQIELERELYARYQIDPETITYVEAHGTGTKLGDPIELEALATVFSEKTSKKNYCALGSVKSNIGHVSGAAGVASVQKVLLSMQHKTLVPSLNVQNENALFDFKSSPFYICREKQAWDVSAGSPRRAGVSSFGFSGTNAHLVLEEYRPPENQQAASSFPQDNEIAIVLSARTPEQLQRKAQDLLDFIRRKQSAGSRDLAAMAYTLQVGREALKERLAIVVRSSDELLEKLNAYVAGTPSIAGVHQGQAGRDKDALALFNTHADLRETTEKWLAAGKFSSLVELWVKGVEVDWSKRYAGQNTPRRANLPTYPFAKERYWAAEPARPVLAAPVAKQDALVTKQRLTYVPRWSVSALEPSATGDFPAGPVLVLDASDELFLSLKEKLKETSTPTSIVLVTPGEVFQESAPDIFTIDSEREAHFHRLAESLDARGQLPLYVVHHGSRTAEFSIHPVFHLCKALMARKHHARLRMLSIFSSDPDGTNPHQAALAGFFKTLTLENPKYMAKVVEMRTAASPEATLPEKTRIVLQELGAASWPSTEVRYEEHRRHVRELVRYLPERRPLADLPLKQGGVYILSGGLGGLGFIFSEYLVKNFQARLVLLGRSSLTPAQQGKLLRLTQQQPDILYLQADVSRLADVERVVQETKARFGEVNGVIHAAGVTRDAFILKKTREELEAVLAPKVSGVTNLDRATSGENLDLFVMFSSVAGALGNPGQGDYAYGNSFLDAFAEEREALRVRQQRSGRTLSINWPFWADGGMRLSQSDAALTEAVAGLSALPTQQGLDYWEELLRSDLTQAVALYGIAAKIEAYVGKAVSREVAGQLPRRTLDADALFAEATAYLSRLIGEEIKLAPERIDSRERFETYGIDSIVIGRLNARLASDLGELPKTLFYEYETPEELAKYLAREAQHALANLIDVKVAGGGAAAAGSGPVPLTEIGAEPVSESAPHLWRSPEAEPIAIIGVHGCYPQSRTLEEYWENLRQGKDLVSVVPVDRWDAEAFYDGNPERAADGKIYCKWGAFLEDFDKFDAPFFNIPADEARVIDPQERLFLGSVWAALEDAGYTRDSLKRYFPKAKSAGVGVFVGVTTSSYNLLASEAGSRGNMASPSALPWSIANRVSYFFDFQGPSMPVDTACSSSLVALHLACESLRRRECQLAIAGGVNLYLHPAKYASFCQRRMLATGGKCRSFGAGDDGFVPGEGVGSLILKPLSKAIEHGDQVYAVIAATACDHSGRSNGYSAPNPGSQARLIGDALGKAGIHPESISYIEGHGTGTQLGDSLEIVALTQAFRQQTAKQQFCAVGSVKANLGHAESAAGIAGVTKILLQMKHRQLAPSLHSDEVNPNIEFKSSPFYLQHGLTQWESTAARPRRALINSFGAGGVNACAVLEEYVPPRVAPEVAPPGSYLIVLSAKTADRLAEYVDRLIDHVRKQNLIDLAALSYTLQVGREAMPERLALVVTGAQDLVEKLGEWSREKTCADVLRGSLDPRRRAGKVSRKSLEGLQAPVAAGQLLELAQAWIAGEAVEWGSLYSQQRPTRISLPTYPFARERHWVSSSQNVRKQPEHASVSAQLHPLVSYNSSTLLEVSFSSFLSGHEFYARDHRVHEQMIFPGSGFLEMACVCASLAGAKQVCRIQDVVWIHPLALGDESRMIQISLKPADNSAEYIITSCDEHRERVVHSEGIVIFQDGSAAGAGDERLPLEALQERCSRQLDGAHFYELFKKSGISYGPAFRTMQKVSIGESFALCKLEIAAHLGADFDEFILHPCIIDGAFQAVSALMGGIESPAPYLPFAIDEVEILRHTARSCYVHVQQAAPEKRGNAEVRKFNIKIANEKGLVLVSFKNFCVRALKVTPPGTKLSS